EADALAELEGHRAAPASDLLEAIVTAIQREREPVAAGRPEIAARLIVPIDGERDLLVGIGHELDGRIDVAAPRAEGELGIGAHRSLEKERALGEVGGQAAVPAIIAPPPALHRHHPGEVAAEVNAGAAGIEVDPFHHFLAQYRRA